MKGTELATICEGLLFRAFRQVEVGSRGIVVALTSPTPRSGVTQITNALTRTLCQDGNECAVAINCGRLQQAGSWHGAQSSLSQELHRIRLRFEYTLIDCPSLKNTQDAVRLAPYVDGIILVLEADRTQKEQLLYAEKTLEAANGKILGHVLNKRAYVVPKWCFRTMEAVGL